jgi:DUF971 family protein
MADMDPRTTPLRLNLKKDEKLEIQWQDGVVSNFPIAFLRDNCPCASCKTFREEQAKKPRSKLTVLGGNVSRGPVVASGAQLVGGYALRIDWSDAHNSGIYSFNYLRELAESKM